MLGKKIEGSLKPHFLLFKAGVQGLFLDAPSAVWHLVRAKTLVETVKAKCSVYVDIQDFNLSVTSE